MSKYVKTLFELITLIVLFIGAIHLVWNFLYAISI